MFPACFACKSLPACLLMVWASKQGSYPNTQLPHPLPRHPPKKEKCYGMLHSQHKTQSAARKCIGHRPLWEFQKVQLNPRSTFGRIYFFPEKIVIFSKEKLGIPFWILLFSSVNSTNFAKFLSKCFISRKSKPYFLVSFSIGNKFH
jgi:hypothetical protein